MLMRSGGVLAMRGLPSSLFSADFGGIGSP
jgi:hypothetical protein